MHIVIGIITALASLVWALNNLQRSGFNLSSFNPLHWYRRNQWRKKYQESPLYCLDEPMDAVAAILLGMAKLEGEMSREHKRAILSIFSEEFNLGAEKAKALFASTSYLLQPENNVIKNAGKVLLPSIERFSSSQADSTIALMTRVAKIENDISTEQHQLISAVKKILVSANKIK